MINVTITTIKRQICDYSADSADGRRHVLESDQGFRVEIRVRGATLRATGSAELLPDEEQELRELLTAIEERIMGEAADPLPPVDLAPPVDTAAALAYQLQQTIGQIYHAETDPGRAGQMAHMRGIVIGVLQQLSPALAQQQAFAERIRDARAIERGQAPQKGAPE